MNKEVHALYRIEFPNGKRYIGKSKNAKRRFIEHERSAMKHPKLLVHKAIRKYIGKVTFHILCYGDKTYISILEKSAITAFNTRNIEYGYNIAAGGEGGSSHCKPHSYSSRSKMSQSAKQKYINNPDLIENLRLKNLGKKRTYESIEKAASANRGKKRNKEFCNRLSILNKGKIHSNESKIKMSIAAKKRLPMSEETKNKLRQKALTQWSDENIKNKMINAAKARCLKPESIEKLKLACRKRWNKYNQESA